MNKILKIATLLFGIIIGLKYGILVEAANNYKSINISDTSVKVGETTFSSKDSEDLGLTIYAEKDGVKKQICSGQVSCEILTNGEEIFYIVSTNNGKEKIVYRKQIDSGIEEKLFSVNEYSLGLCGYWNNKLYYVKGLDPGQFCSYELATGVINVLLDDVTEAYQHGHYFITNPYAGAPVISPLKSYDAEKEKVKTISKNNFGYNIISGKVYYINISPGEIKKYYRHKAYKIVVFRCNLDGAKKKKILSKKINGDISKIGKNSIKYWDKNRRVRTIKYK